MFGSTLRPISLPADPWFANGHCGVICLLLVLSVYTEAQAQASRPPLTQIDQLRAAGRFVEARDALEDLAQREPENSEAWWRLARTYVELGDVEESKSERARLLDRGREAAQCAIDHDSTNSNAHLSLAITVGRIAMDSGTRDRVELSRVLKEHVDRAIELDSTNALAYHVRGRWNYAIADLGFFERAAVKLVYGGIPAASFEQAARDYQLAAQLENSVINHLELGRTLLRMGKDDRAKAALQRALEIPNADPSDGMYKEEARELLRKVE